MSLNLLGNYDSSSADDSDTTETENIGYIQSAGSPATCSMDIINTSKDKGQSYFEGTHSDVSSSSEGTVQSAESSSSSGSGNESTNILPLPQIQRIHSGQVDATPGSVFSNPYKEEEDAKLAILKKHVSLGPTEEPHQQERKRHFNRSRRGWKRRQQMGRGEKEEGPFDEHDSSIKKRNTNKVKSGLSEGLVPSSKYMKLHEKQQAKERPWTLG